MPITLIKTLSLEFTAVKYQAQLTNCELQRTYSDTSIETFGDGIDPQTGVQTDTTLAEVLHLEGFQDWGAVASLCELLEATDVTDLIPFTLEVAGTEWTGNVNARKPGVGGAAGEALSFTIDLPVAGTVTYTPAP